MQHTKDAANTGGDSHYGWAACTCGAEFDGSNAGAAAMRLSAHVKREVAALDRHAAEIVGYFESMARPYDRSDHEWLFRCAARNGDYHGTDPMEAGRVLSVYFTERPGHTAHDGWTITANPSVMRQTILRQCS